VELDGNHAFGDCGSRRPVKAASKNPCHMRGNSSTEAGRGTSVIAYHRVRVQPDRLRAGAPGLVSICHLRAHRLPAARTRVCLVQLVLSVMP
jgi:hypothetical protein